MLFSVFCLIPLFTNPKAFHALQLLIALNYFIDPLSGNALPLVSNSWLAL
jgi:hypothetical protein